MSLDWSKNRALRLIAVAAVVAAMVVPAVAPVGADEPQPSEKAKEPVADRYALPEGDDVDALVKFIEDLEGYQPQNFLGNMEHRKKAPAAIFKAAEKIQKLQPDPSSAAYQKAAGYLLRQRAAKISQAEPSEQRKIVNDLAAYFGRKELKPQDFALAASITTELEYGPNEELAAEAYRRFGDIFAESDDELLARAAARFQGAARRLDLVGNEMTLEGTTFGGDKFDWSAYRGKVVLVDFWATWCGPCVAEIPSIRKSYDTYHDRGFEVIGISLDQDREALEKFLEEKKIPWTILHEADGGGQHPAAEHYGIVGIPTMVLVGKDGKVITLKARGPQLETQLEKLLGKTEPAAKKGS